MKLKRCFISYIRSSYSRLAIIRRWQKTFLRFSPFIATALSKLSPMITTKQYRCNKEDMAKKCATNKDAMHKRITLQSDLSSLTDTKRAKQVSQTNRVRFQGKCLLPLNNEQGSHRRILLIW